MTSESQQALQMYNDLLKIRHRGPAENVIREFFGSWKHKDHAAQMQKMAAFFQSHPAVVVELVGNQMVDDRVAHDLLVIMSGRGSVSKKDNEHMVSVYAALRKCNVSDGMKIYLDWLWDVHGY